MKELGCYTDGQRQVIDAADTWACPACTGLTMHKKSTENVSLEKSSERKKEKKNYVGRGNSPYIN
eukprot:284176-Pelagomonas_calceolata.AAC.1